MTPLDKPDELLSVCRDAGKVADSWPDTPYAREATAEIVAAGLVAVKANDVILAKPEDTAAYLEVMRAAAVVANQAVWRIADPEGAKCGSSLEVIAQARAKVLECLVAIASLHEHRAIERLNLGGPDSITH